MRQASVPSRVVYTCDMVRATRPLKESTAGESLASLAGGPLEACSDMEAGVVACDFHPLIAALHAAFVDHRPLVLSPDMFWLLIAQGFAKILNEDPEGMRAQFVAHSGKLTLEIQRDDFVLGSTHNDWPGVFRDFSGAIRQHVGNDNYEALVATFSTTGPVERAANEIVFLGAMQCYFELVVSTICGIPEIILEGTPQDWIHLAGRAKNVRDRYGCGWWLDHVVPLLDRMASAASGDEDPALWASIYKWESTSWGSFAGGWIVQFFPFLSRSSGLKRNHYLGINLDKLGLTEMTRDGVRARDLVGVRTNQWPGALSRAPFAWNRAGTKMAMQFVAGFTHCTQDEETLAIRPAIGWGVLCARGPSMLRRILGALGLRTAGGHVTA